MINKYELENIEKELKEWSDFLNLGVGVVSFNLAIASSGSAHPQIFSFLSWLVILFILNKGIEKFPKKIHELRKEELVGIDELVWRGIEAKYFGLTNFFFKINLFLIGIISLTFVMVGIL